jgi:hypothetical protein
MRSNSNNEKSTGLASASLGVISQITAGINKKSFFKGFLGRGSSQKNEPAKSTNLNSTQGHRKSFVGGSNSAISNIQSVAMNMMAFKNQNKSGS